MHNFIINSITVLFKLYIFWYHNFSKVNKTFFVSNFFYFAINILLWLKIFLENMLVLQVITKYIPDNEIIING